MEGRAHQGTEPSLSDRWAAGRGLRLGVGESQAGAMTSARYERRREGSDSEVAGARDEKTCMIRGAPPPARSSAAAQPGYRPRIPSTESLGLLERLRVQRPLSVREVRHTPRLPPRRAISSADSGTT
jgi:hypothetical protein